MDDAPQIRVDPRWERVRQALAKPDFDFRTVWGISRETGFSDEEIEDLLRSHRDEVRMAYWTDQKGRRLYTLRSKSPSLSEFLSNVKTVVSSSSST